MGLTSLFLVTRFFEQRTIDPLLPDAHYTNIYGRDMQKNDFFRPRGLK